MEQKLLESLDKKLRAAFLEAASFFCPSEAIKIYGVQDLKFLDEAICKEKKAKDKLSQYNLMLGINVKDIVVRRYDDVYSSPTGVPYSLDDLIICIPVLVYVLKEELEVCIGNIRIVNMKPIYQVATQGSASHPHTTSYAYNQIHIKNKHSKSGARPSSTTYIDWPEVLDDPLAYLNQIDSVGKYHSVLGFKEVGGNRATLQMMEKREIEDIAEYNYMMDKGETFCMGSGEIIDVLSSMRIIDKDTEIDKLVETFVPIVGASINLMTMESREGGPYRELTDYTNNPHYKYTIPLLPLGRASAEAYRKYVNTSKYVSASKSINTAILNAMRSFLIEELQNYDNLEQYISFDEDGFKLKKIPVEIKFKFLEKFYEYPILRIDVLQEYENFYGSNIETEENSAKDILKTLDYIDDFNRDGNIIKLLHNSTKLLCPKIFDIPKVEERIISLVQESRKVAKSGDEKGIIEYFLVFKSLLTPILTEALKDSPNFEANHAPITYTIPAPGGPRAKTIKIIDTDKLRETLLSSKKTRSLEEKGQTFEQEEQDFLDNFLKILDTESLTTSITSRTSSAINSILNEKSKKKYEQTFL